MNVFVAGATGAIGRRLVPLLVARGHEVVGTTRTASKADALRAAGARPVVLDALDREAVREAVLRAEPEVVVHELTALTGLRDIRRFDEAAALTNRLRTEGTDHLLAAAREAGARRFVAQSFAGTTYARTGGPVKAEDDPLDPDPPAAFRRTFRAIRHLEGAVLGAEGLEGIVLRYGFFYGPGTSLGRDGFQIEDIRRRRLPILGRGTGVWSFIHIDDAATATVASIERGKPGVYNVVDDDPAPVAEWLPALAAAVGAKPPRRVPVWLGRLLAGEHGAAMMTENRGASNEKAKRELGWRPAYPSWRTGFREGLGEGAESRAAGGRSGCDRGP
ncbi:MAG TPA: NAD(P)-dependent oxidoreductase [Actinomycetota bacterium]|nr:NAD(P)-dependent oxidoreductase [Actinomycetota bacterium]